MTWSWRRQRPRGAAMALASVTLLLACGGQSGADSAALDDDAPTSTLGPARRTPAASPPHGPATTTTSSTTTTSTTSTTVPPVDRGPRADRVLEGEESFPGGFTVPAGEIWELAPGTDTTVTTGANVVVRGVLRMRPEDHRVQHTLQFEGVDESAFAGGGMEVVDSDVGLWVMGEGQLDIAGSPRAGWNRTGDDPTWRPDDEVVVAPTEPGDSTTFAPFTPGDPVPTVSHGERTYAAEVMNLTRNVLIRGRSDGDADLGDGRAHILIHSSRPQSIRYAELRHLGPRQAGEGDDPTEGVLGRYPLHFHHNGEGSRGSLVEGVVVRDSGNRAFVPHMSHGITFSDTVAFNVYDDAYWWDPDPTGHGGPARNATNDLVYEHAMAAYVRSDPGFRGYLLSGFVLGEGRNLTVTDSVAVGIQGNETASGFHWPESANGNEHNVWDFHGNVAHNNAVSGIFVWQNDENDHVVEDFVAYRNGAFGVDHGAYLNEYRYEDLVLFGNGEAGIRSKAGAAGEPQVWTDIVTDGIVIGDHALDSNVPTRFEDVTVDGEITIDEASGNEDGRITYEFLDVRAPGGDLISEDAFDIDSLLSSVTVRGADGFDFDL